MMNEDTKKLLEECTVGCKMGLSSMDQVEDLLQDGELKQVIDTYRVRHEEMDREASELLQRSGEEPKEPGMAATAFSWLTTEMKLMMKDDHHQIAKLMMDGCNMGIQSISENANRYTGASEEAKNVASRLVQTEESFMKDLTRFI
ncbi:MAG: hypothetical protein ACOYBE_09180 [Blautia sp.]